MAIHSKEAINNPQILAYIFAEMHSAYNKQKAPMTTEQSRYTISVLVAEDRDINGMYDDFANNWQFAAFFNRCQIFPLQYEKRLQIWLALMTFEYGIGAMILVGYYVQWWAFTLKDKDAVLAKDGGVVTFDLIVHRCFPFGVFSKETLHEFWDKQKVVAKPDNLLDHPGAALSFMPAKNQPV